MALFTLALPVPTVFIRRVSDRSHEERRPPCSKCDLCFTDLEQCSNNSHCKSNLSLTLWSNEIEGHGDCSEPRCVDCSLPVKLGRGTGCCGFSSTGTDAGVTENFPDIGEVLEHDTTGCPSEAVPEAGCDHGGNYLYCPVTCKRLRSLLPEAYILHQDQGQTRSSLMNNTILSPRDLHTMHVSLIDVEVPFIKSRSSLPLWLDVPLQLCTFSLANKGEANMNLQWRASPSIQEALLLPLSSPFWVSPVLLKQPDISSPHIQTQFVLARLNVSDENLSILSRDQEQRKTRLLLMAPLADPDAGSTATLKSSNGGQREFELCIHLENSGEHRNTGGRAKVLLCIEAPEETTVEQVLQRNCLRESHHVKTLTKLCQVTYMY